VDVAFQQADRSTSFRCCVCDSDGRFVAAQAQWRKGHMSVLEGEALALLEEIRFTITNRWEFMTFESDS